MTHVTLAGGTIVSTASAGGPDHLTVVRDPSPEPMNWTRPSDRRLTPQKVWESQPAVRKVVSYVARAVGAVPWRAMIKAGEAQRVRAEDSPVERLLATPGGIGVTGDSLVAGFVTDWLLHDNAAMAVLDGALARIPPARLAWHHDALGRLTGLELLGEDGRPVADLTHTPKVIVQGWAAEGGPGVSPLRTLADLLEEASRAIAWRTQQWQHAIKQPGLLTRPADAPKWNEKHRDRFLESWGKWKHTDADGTPVLEHGMDYKELRGPTPKDAQDVEGRQLTDAEVASFFHVPPELVGAREASFANVTAFRRMLYGPVVGPLIKELQQAVNATLVPALDPRPGLYLEANVAGMMAGSPEEQARAYATAVGAPYKTRAEVRAEAGLPFLEGSDELVTPLNITMSNRDGEGAGVAD